MNKSKQLRGFALLSAEKRHAIASMGGIAAQKSGKAFRLTPEKARAAQAKRKVWKKNQNNK